MKKAIVFGASGFVGSYLLEMLLQDPDYKQVTVVVRKPLPASATSALAPHSTKLKTLIGDLDSLPSLQSELQGDEVFIALGTTRKHTPDPAEYYRVDHDYPVLAAKLAKENGAKSVFVVSAVGADADSRFFYVKTKGEMERDIRALGFEHTHIFQPSMIVGNRQEKRPMEKTLIKFWSVLDPLFIGALDRYRGIDGKDIAKAMVRAAKNQPDKIKIYRWPEMSR